MEFSLLARVGATWAFDRTRGYRRILNVRDLPYTLRVVVLTTTASLLFVPELQVNDFCGGKYRYRRGHAQGDGSTQSENWKFDS